MNIKIFRYLVLFIPSNNNLQFEPIKMVDYASLKRMNGDTMHQLDSDLIPVLDLLEYCLHLPRNEFDVCDFDVEVTEALRDNPQDIFLCPYNMANQQILSSFDMVLCDDNCFQSIKEKIKELNITAECISNKDVSNKTLARHWYYLYGLRNIKSALPVPDIEKQYLFTGEQMLFLPVLFIARQFGNVEKIYEKAFNSINIFEDVSAILSNFVFHNRALLKCKGAKGKNIFRKTFYQAFECEKKSGRFDLVITFPGISKNQITYGGLSSSLPNVEKRAIRIIGVHKAIAKKAILMELPMINQELFQRIKNIEIAFGNGNRPNNKYIHKMLHDESRIFESCLTKAQMYVLKRAQQITVFSDYPLGLYIPNGCDTTLQCQKELSSRMLTPLTKCFQIELPKHPVLYLGCICRVMFVECVKDTSENKVVRVGSSALFSGLKDNSKRCNKFTCEYFETYTIKDLKRVLQNRYKEFDVLILSAYGFYDRQRNISGLLIGNEQWLANDNDFFTPPIVILSACNTSPRGNGSVSAADMFLRSGAEAILSSFTPISSLRNAHLLNRLFVYVVEAQLGSKQYKTLLSAWAGVVATNAVLEITNQSKRFDEWLMSENKFGEARFNDFALKKSKGRLRTTNIYEDTITILKEMLREEGIGNSFQDILNEKNYFPESFFYQWIGFPDNIFIYDENYENYMKK